MLKFQAQADRIAEEFASYSDEDKDWSFFALAMYDVSESYEAWAHLCAYDANDEQVHEYYGLVHQSYMSLWKKLGSREFFSRLDAQKRKITILRGTL